MVPIKGASYSKQQTGMPGAGHLLGLALALFLLHVVARYDYVLFHTTIEILRVVVLGGIFILAWHSRGWSENTFLRVIGIRPWRSPAWSSCMR